MDADYAEAEADPNKGQQGEKDTEMRSRPNFEIDVKKGNKILTFSCSYLQEPASTDPQQDEYRELDMRLNYLIFLKWLLFHIYRRCFCH